LDSNEEIWKPIPGYEGLYSISNLGRVKSYYKGGRLLCLHNHDGYICVRLYKKNRRRPTFQVHRLVLAAFIGTSELKCNHKNAIKSDNRLENLEYVTQKENIIHAAKLGLMKHDNPMRKRKPVIATSLKDGTTKKFGSFHEAAKAFGKSTWNISAAANGKIKSIHGYIWRLA